MTHHISGFIGPTQHLKDQTKELTNAQVIPLAQGMAFLPMGNELYEEIYKFNHYPMRWLAKKFKPVPIAWIETDYFGGAGEQSAILWKDGKKRRFRDRYGGNIDAAMKELGVVCEGDQDEFDTLGLGKYRLNEDWLWKEY
jgi:hypothetical protein